MPNYLYRYNPDAKPPCCTIHIVLPEYPDRLLCNSGRSLEGWARFEPDYDPPLRGYCFCQRCNQLLERRRRLRREREAARPRVINLPKWMIGGISLCLCAVLLGACGDYGVSDPLPGCKTLVPAGMILLALLFKGGVL